jgi:GTP-binding protein HflX
MPFLLSDTVGFIRKLPHHLVESFKSTLDEVKESDILIHVVDISHEAHEDHIHTVNQTLTDLGVLEKPTLYVFNKIDRYRQKNYDELIDKATKLEIENDLSQHLKNRFENENIFISAISGENLDLLKETIGKMVKDMYDRKYPYQSKHW